jgi:hypothetical protein
MAIINPGDENETTQPIPVTTPYGRPSKAPETTTGDVTLSEPVRAVAPFDSSANSAVEEVADDAAADEEYEDEEDDDEGGSTARLAMVFIGVMVLLAGAWFAWTKFGKTG